MIKTIVFIMYSNLSLALIYLLLIILLNVFCNKYSLLIYQTFNFKHKRKIELNKRPILSGGVYMFFSLLIFSFFNDLYLLDYIIFSLFFLILGLASDLNYWMSPRKRLIIMTIASFIILTNSQIIINEIDIKIIDYFLKFNVISLIIFSFFLSSLLNGSNFIDGNNGNFSIYYTLVYSVILFKLNLEQIDAKDQLYIYSIISMLVIFSFFNLCNKNYNGDNGVYFFSFITGIYFLFLYSEYSINFLLIICLLIYPLTELFFSMTRKMLENQDPFLPDKLHLHQLLEKIIKIKISKKYHNNLSTLFLTFFNFFYMFFLSQVQISKKICFKIITSYIMIYVILYYFFRLLLIINEKKKLHK